MDKKKMLIFIGICLLVFFGLLAFVIWSCSDEVRAIEVIDVTYEAGDAPSQQETFIVGRSGEETYSAYIWFFIDSGTPNRITSAKLRLAVKDGGIPLEACAVVWDDNIGVYRETKAVAVEMVQYGEGWSEYDVTDAAEAMLREYGNAIMLKAKDEGAKGMAEFFSVGSEYPPELTVSYMRTRS